MRLYLTPCWSINKLSAIAHMNHNARENTYICIFLHICIFWHFPVFGWNMMTSSNANIFRVTGHLYGEFTGPRWIHHTTASDADTQTFITILFITVNYPHKGQWRGALMFSFICARTNGWVNNRETGDLRRHRAHYEIIVMISEDEIRFFAGSHGTLVIYHL